MVTSKGMERVNPKNIERRRPKINLSVGDTAYCLTPLEKGYYTEITQATIVGETIRKTKDGTIKYYDFQMECQDHCVLTIDENNGEATRDEETYVDGRRHRHIKLCNSKEELLEIYKSEKIKFLKERIEEHRESIKHCEEHIKDSLGRIEQLKNNDFTGMIKENFIING